MPNRPTPDTKPASRHHRCRRRQQFFGPFANPDPIKENPPKTLPTIPTDTMTCLSRSSALTAVINDKITISGRSVPLNHDFDAWNTNHMVLRARGRLNSLQKTISNELGVFPSDPGREASRYVNSYVYVCTLKARPSSVSKASVLWTRSAPTRRNSP